MDNPELSIEYLYGYLDGLRDWQPDLVERSDLTQEASLDEAYMTGWDDGFADKNVYYDINERATLIERTYKILSEIKNKNLITDFREVQWDDEYN